MSNAQRDIRRKQQGREYTTQSGNVRKTCRYLGIPRSLFYVWRRACERDGEAGLVNRRPIARSHPKTTRPEIVDQVLHRRRTYHLGCLRHSLLIRQPDLCSCGHENDDSAAAIASALAWGSVARSRSSRWTAIRWLPSAWTTRSGRLSRFACATVLLPAMMRPCRSISTARPAPCSRRDCASAARPRSVPRLALWGSTWRSGSRSG